MAPELPPHTTISYKKIGDQDVYFDLYSPLAGLTPAAGEIVAVPAVVYFHGGGLTVGTRASWFPYWIHGKMLPTQEEKPNRLTMVLRKSFGLGLRSLINRLPTHPPCHWT